MFESFTEDKRDHVPIDFMRYLVPYIRNLGNENGEEYSRNLGGNKWKLGKPPGAA